METVGFGIEKRHDLADLRAQSLKDVALFAGIIAYGWLLLTFWQHEGAPPFFVWLPPAALTALAGLSAVLRIQSRQEAPIVPSLLLILATFAAIALAMVGYRSRDLAYLFIVGVAFTNVLLGQRMTMLTAFAATVLIGVIGTTHLHLPLFSAGLGFPMFTVVLTAFALHISARNLYTALAWVWNGYDRARRNEERARDQQSELRQALKALDEATYRLERANQMLALARDQAEEARRLKQQFAQTISHELRTPLNLIVGFSEMMAQSLQYYGTELPAAFVRDLSTVHRNARHLQTLINDVLDLARIEAAQMALIPEQTDPAALVEEAVGTARSLVEARGLALHTEIEPDLPPLWLDPIRIRQVLFNLLNNATRYTERGSVTVSAQREGEGVIISVADTGVGIAEENLPRVFQEFQQLDGSTRRRHAGAGLGLAISRQFVELHGGHIWVESTLGRGSTFSFSLPCEQPVRLLQDLAPAKLIRKTPLKWREEPVLLGVTRSPSAATLLARYLHGYRVVIASDLEQAQRMAQEIYPQAVLIDQASADAIAGSLEELARAWELPRTPFLTCPLPGEEPLRQRLDVNGYLIKPISRATLWDAVRQFGDEVDRVLIIDDDPDFVRLVRRMLDSPVRRYQVSGSYSGRDGLDRLYRQPPDLLLLDLVLPDISGLQIIAQMRAHPALRQLPVIVVSGEEEMDNVTTLRGVSGFAKAEGLTPGEVVHWIQSVLSVESRLREKAEAG